jgi:hypothetical protein
MGVNLNICYQGKHVREWTGEKYMSLRSRDGEEAEKNVTVNVFMLSIPNQIILG